VELKTPYFLYLGDAHDQLAAKTSGGVAYWRPEACVGQFRLPGCKADLGLADLTMEEAAGARGAKTVIVGIANRGGVIAEALAAVADPAPSSSAWIWRGGLHRRLTDVPRAQAPRRQAWPPARRRSPPDPGGSTSAAARKRRGKRLLTVGTDCSLGKMYTSLAIEREMRRRGNERRFPGDRADWHPDRRIRRPRSTPSSPTSSRGRPSSWRRENGEDHWGRDRRPGARLFHPSFAGVSLGLLHGAQPDAPRHVPRADAHRTCAVCRTTSCRRCASASMPISPPAASPTRRWRVVGISINTAALDASAADSLLKQTEDAFGMPCVDPVRGRRRADRRPALRRGEARPCPRLDIRRDSFKLEQPFAISRGSRTVAEVVGRRDP